MSWHLVYTIFLTWLTENHFMSSHIGLHVLLSLRSVNKQLSDCVNKILLYNQKVATRMFLVCLYCRQRGTIPKIYSGLIQKLRIPLIPLQIFFHLAPLETMKDQTKKLHEKMSEGHPNNRRYANQEVDKMRDSTVTDMYLFYFYSNGFMLTGDEHPVPVYPLGKILHEKEAQGIKLSIGYNPSLIDGRPLSTYKFYCDYSTTKDEDETQKPPNSFLMSMFLGFTFKNEFPSDFFTK